MNTFTCVRGHIFYAEACAAFCSCGALGNLVGSITFELHGQFDARVWAREFARCVALNPTLPFDEGTMLGWFANAIMAGHDHATRARDAEIQQLREQLAQAERRSRINAEKYQIAEGEVTAANERAEEYQRMLDEERAQAVATIESLRAQIAAANDRSKELEQRKDGAYEERNRVVAALARLAVAAGIRVVVTNTAIEGWSEDWHGCVYIDLPCGQSSWHFHDSQAYLFADLPTGEMHYDGHTTAQKYERMHAWRPTQITAQPDVEKIAEEVARAVKEAMDCGVDAQTCISANDYHEQCINVGRSAAETVLRKHIPASQPNVLTFWNAQAEWSNATFGDEQVRGPVGPLRHLAKEVTEAIAAIGTESFLEEMGDALAILLDAARRGGLTLDDLVAQMFRKIAVNKTRKWPATHPSEPVEHVRGGTMIYDYERDKFILSSGRVIYAHGGVLGIKDDCESVTEGYDGAVYDQDDDGNEIPLTPEERREIAEAMVMRWAKFGHIRILNAD